MSILTDFYEKLDRSNAVIECLGTPLTLESSKEELLGALYFASETIKNNSSEYISNLEFMRNMMDLK